MRAWWGWLLVGLILALAGACTPPSGSAPTTTTTAAAPMGLEGESFQAEGSIALTEWPPCAGSEVNSFEYAMSGGASGPYPGTFTATGTLTIGYMEWTDAGFPLGPVVQFDGSFHIDSPVGNVSGTIALDPQASPWPLGGCSTPGFWIDQLPFLASSSVGASHGHLSFTSFVGAPSWLPARSFEFTP